MTALQGVIWFSIFEDSKLSAEEYLNDVIEFIIHGFTK
jgi:methionine salvage enolase-phosphatase E1